MKPSLKITFALCGFIHCSVLVAAETSNTPQRLPAEIVAQWRKAGAELGWGRPGTYYPIGVSGVNEGVQASDSDPWRGLQLETASDENGKPGDIPTFSFFGEWKPEVLATLPVPVQAFGLSLSHQDELTEKDLANLARFKHLQMLDLWNSSLNDKGLESISTIHSLQLLRIDDTKVTGAGLKHLSELKNLRFLNLSGTSINDVSLAALAKLQKLQFLHLGGTSVSDVGMKSISTLKSLRALSIAGTKITDGGMKQVAALSQLEGLDVRGTGITDAGLIELSALKQLRQLYAERTQATADGLVRAGLDVEAPFASSKFSRVKSLIEMLASKNPKPSTKNDSPFHEPEISFSKDKYNPDLQIPVYLAIQQLLSEGEVAIELLLRHPQDDRYSISAYAAGSFNMHVSAVCESLVQISISCFKPEINYITYDQEHVYPKLAVGESLGEWWAKNKHRGLMALQLEAIDANLDFFKTVDGKKARPIYLSENRYEIDDFNKMRDENIVILKTIRASIVARGESYRPKAITRLQRGIRFVGLPW